MAALLRRIDIESVLTPDVIIKVGSALLIGVLSFIALRVVVFIVRRMLKKRTTAQVTMLVSRGINYTGLGLIISFVLLELGVDLAPVLGAAGIVGLAVGIASQASLSNMISGLFLISEKPFAVGDVIKTGEVLGVVTSIDMLSVKIRTFDNQYVRVPNEKLANNTLTNITRFPIRRMDFRLTVAFGTDLDRLKELLIAIASTNEKCLNEPAPFFVISEVSDQGPRITFGVWFAGADFLAVKNTVTVAILKRFEEEEITIPVSTRSLRAEVGSDPIPVRVVNPLPDQLGDAVAGDSGPAGDGNGAGGERGA